MTPRTDHILYTIGYQGRVIDEYIRLLKSASIERLVDVRQSARSRKADFNKNKLAAHLDTANIEYIHMPQLGAPKALRDPYLAHGDWDTFCDGFTAHLTTPEVQDGLVELQELARERNTVITCICRDPERCHRGILAGEMEKKGFGVEHLGIAD